MIEVEINDRRVRDEGEPQNEVWIRLGEPLGTIVFSPEDSSNIFLRRTTPGSELSFIAWNLPGVLRNAIGQLSRISSGTQLSAHRRPLIDQAQDHLETYLRTASESLLAE